MSESWFIYCALKKKSGTKEASEREPSFLHPHTLQLPLLIFYLSAIWWHDGPTDQEGGMDGVSGSLLRTRRDVEEIFIFALMSASFFRRGKEDNAQLEIFLVLFFRNLFFRSRT